jgi:hypothetical protein
MQNPPFNTSADPMVDELLAGSIASLLMADNAVRLIDVLAIIDRVQTGLHQRPPKASELMAHREAREEEIDHQNACRCR